MNVDYLLDYSLYLNAIKYLNTHFSHAEEKRYRYEKFNIVKPEIVSYCSLFESMN